MKKILCIAILLLAALSCKAQNTIIDLVDRCNHQLYENTGDLYLKDVNNLYAPFVGTWKWTEGNREFILTLIKQTKYHYNQRIDNYYEDRIVGYYIYKENGLVLATTVNDNLNEDYGLNVDFDLDCYSQLSSNRFQDVLKNKNYDGWIELVSPTQIKFHFKDDTHMRKQMIGYTELPPQYHGNTFPLDMVLIKQ
jgi:hypothetical protein